MSRHFTPFIAALILVAVSPGLAVAGDISVVSNGTPVANAAVSVNTLGGNQLAAAQTDAGGIAKVAIPPRAAGQPVVVKVTDEAGKVSQQSIAAPSGQAPEAIAMDTEGGIIGYDREAYGHLKRAREPVTVGANGDVGCNAKLKERVTETVGGMLGGFLGGGGGGGGGGFPGMGGGGRGGMPGMGPPKSAGPDIQTVADPIADDAKRVFTDPATGTRIAVGTQLTRDGLQVSTKILDAPCDGSFQSIYLMDALGNKAGPTRYDIYDMYLDWKLTVSWTYDRWVNNQHVEHKEGGWSKDGRELLGTFRVPAGKDGIWSRMGFSNAVKGIKGLGATFPVDAGKFIEQPMTLVVHVANADADPVTTVPFVIGLSPAVRTAAGTTTCSPGAVSRTTGGTSVPRVAGKGLELPIDLQPVEGKNLELPGVAPPGGVDRKAEGTTQAQKEIDDLKALIARYKKAIEQKKIDYKEKCEWAFGYFLTGHWVFAVGKASAMTEYAKEIYELKEKLKELEEQLKVLEGDSVVPYLQPIVVLA